MSAAQRISARDYKHGSGRRGGFDITQYQQFFVGLGLGLLVALAVYVTDHRAKAPPAEVARKAGSAAPGAAVAPAPEAADPAAEYEFYDVLSRSEVPAGTQRRDAQRNLPSVPIKQAGAYVIQVASFKNQTEAERMRERVGKLAIDATIQRVAIDEDVRYRINVGPMRDLDKLNATRRLLRSADIDSVLVIRVGD